MVSGFPDVRLRSERYKGVVIQFTKRRYSKWVTARAKVAGINIKEESTDKEEASALMRMDIDEMISDEKYVKRGR